MSSPNLITRRGFLDRSFKLGLGVALSTLVDIPFVMKRALAQGNLGLNGKKLLFIWLRGANDGLNSVIPVMDPAYSSSRPSIKLDPDPGTQYATLGLADFPTGAASTYAYSSAIRLGNGFAALHPSLKFLAPLYNSGDLALIHRVAYPKQSRSHFGSQNYWENGFPNNNLVKDGIFYRAMLEYLREQGPNASALTGVSVQSALPLILRGSEAPMTNLTDPTRYDLLGIPNTAAGNLKAGNMLDLANTSLFAPKQNRDLLQLQYENLKNTLSIFAAINFTEEGNTYRDDVITDGDQEWADLNGGQGYYLFPTTPEKNGGWLRAGTVRDANRYVVPTSLQNFFRNLKSAAIILNKTDAIIAGSEFGGFDTHNSQGGATGTHANLNRGIGWAMYALKKYFTQYADKATWNDVVVVTLSEFGRTTIENSDMGTDHAEAEVMFMAGGAVKGYGKGNPSGVFNCHPEDPIPWVTGPQGSMFGVNGRYLKRSTDYRSVLGEVIRKHLGASDPQLGRIIPGYADPREHLLAGGESEVDRTQIRGELGLL